MDLYRLYRRIGAGSFDHWYQHCRIRCQSAGGNGGNTYIVAASDGTESIVSNGGTISLIDGAAGIAGKAGSGGAAGAKGMHCDKDNCGQWATSGDDGSNGAKGSNGSAGKTISMP